MKAPKKTAVAPNYTRRLDRFDRVQWADVVSVCAQCPTRSQAGRILFANSRRKKRNPNDADRLRKYLLRFDLSWQDLRASSVRYGRG
jgi:transcriptional regulatory protein RtcR